MKNTNTASSPQGTLTSDPSTPVAASAWHLNVLSSVSELSHVCALLSYFIFEWHAVRFVMCRPPSFPRRIVGLTFCTVWPDAAAGSDTHTQLSGCQRVCWEINFQVDFPAQNSDFSPVRHLEPDRISSTSVGPHSGVTAADCLHMFNSYMWHTCVVMYVCVLDDCEYLIAFIDPTKI